MYEDRRSCRKRTSASNTHPASLAHSSTWPPLREEMERLLFATSQQRYVHGNANARSLASQWPNPPSTPSPITTTTTTTHLQHPHRQLYNKQKPVHAAGYCTVHESPSQLPYALVGLATEETICHLALRPDEACRQLQ